jgi:hypothetical protein
VCDFSTSQLVHLKKHISSKHPNMQLEAKVVSADLENGDFIDLDVISHQT